MLMSLKLKFGFPKGLFWRDRGTLVMSRPNPPNGRGGGCIAANGDENSMLGGLIV